MSYVFLPPRTANYFPASMPYLAGVRGLGDYAADLEAWKKEQAYYKADLKRWTEDKAKYDAAMATYNQAMSQINGAYASAQAQYANIKAQWDADYNTYSAALGAWNAQVAAIRAQNRAKSEQVAKSYGITLPASFLNGDACITQAQKDAYRQACRSGTVKGLVGLGSSSPDCAWAALPVCSFPAKPTLRPMPLPPAKPTFPAKPTLRPMPTPPTTPQPTPPPVVTTTPAVTPTTTPIPGGGEPPATELTPEDDKQANLVMGGLIVAAMLGGGYLVYRTLKKPKAQAA